MVSIFSWLQCVNSSATGFVLSSEITGWWSCPDHTLRCLVQGSPSLVASFTVSLHSTKTGNLHAVRVLQGNVIGLWEREWEFPLDFVLSAWGKIMIPMYKLGYDYRAYMDYMDPNVCCPKKANKLNSSRLSDAYICVIKLSITGSDNGMSPDWHQAIIWTIDGILLIGPVGTNFNEIIIRIHAFSFRKVHFKMLTGIWGPFCLLITHWLLLVTSAHNALLPS